MKTRWVEARDFERLLDMCRAFDKETTEHGAFVGVGFDTEKVLRLFNWYMTHPDTNFAMVLEDEEHGVVGALFGYITEYYFSRDKIACDLAWYVSPEFRGNMGSLKLLQGFQDWAKERGAMEVRIGISSRISPERTAKALEFCGYTFVGSNYKLPIGD